MREPLVAYNLDGNNPLYWSPLTPNRDQGFYDISGGGVINIYPYASGIASLQYFNSTPFSNGIILKPRQDQLGITLNYNVTVRAQCLDATVAYEAFGLLNGLLLLEWLQLYIPLPKHTPQTPTLKNLRKR